MKNENQLLQDVAALIAEVDATKRYSMSRIYGAYNQVFNTNEQAQACSSCLIRKVNKLKIWLGEQQLAEVAKTTKKKKKNESKKDV